MAAVPLFLGMFAVSSTYARSSDMMTQVSLSDEYALDR